jgi:hypothetical protein
MVSTENKEIKVTASDALEFEPVLREPPQGGGWGLKIFLILIVGAVTAGAWVLYGDSALQRLGGGDGVPLIKADTGPVKVRPENPGGLRVPNRDKLVYDRMQSASGGSIEEESRAPERLLPPPEQPLPKPRFEPSAAKPAQPNTPEKLLAVPESTPKPAPKPVPTAKANPVAKVPTLKDVKTAKRPTPPPPPPPAPPASPASPASPAPSAAQAPVSGSSFSEPPSKVAAAKPAKTAPVRTPAKEPAKVAAKVAAKTPVSAPKPAVAPAPRISRDKAYLVQLAAARSSQGAREEWQRLRTKHIDLLGRLGLTVTKADLGAAKGVFYRLRAGPLADEGTARSLCKQLAARKVGCLVIRPMQ